MNARHSVMHLESEKSGRIRALLEHVKMTDGVVFAVLATQDGEVVDAVQETASATRAVQAKRLAAWGCHVKLRADEVGQRTRGGASQCVLIRGTTRQMLVLMAVRHVLVLLLKAECDAGSVESKVRAVLREG